MRRSCLQVVGRVGRRPAVRALILGWVAAFAILLGAGSATVAGPENPQAHPSREAKSGHEGISVQRTPSNDELLPTSGGELGPSLNGTGEVCEQPAPAGVSDLQRAASDSSPSDLQPQFGLSYDSVHRGFSEGQLTLVDVRSKADFTRLRVPGSVHIPLFALRTKTFLKGKPFVLVGAGLSTRQLDQRCSELRSEGFPCEGYLDGGLKHWAERGGPILGDRFVLQRMREIPPEHLPSPRGEPNLSMVAVGLSSEELTGLGSSEVGMLPGVDDPDGFLSGLRALAPRSPGAALLRVVLVPKGGEEVEALRRLLDARPSAQLRGISTYFLQGGLEGWRAYQRVMALTREPRTAVRARPCGSCP